jgi:hypothetical protein
MVYPLALAELSLEGLIGVNHETSIVLSVGLGCCFCVYNSESVLELWQLYFRSQGSQSK